MIFSHPDYYNPNINDYKVLFTVWETDTLPCRWLPHLDRYSDIIVPSEFNVQTFKKYHGNVHKVCWGIDADRMSPWGDRWRFSDKKTFLCVFRDQYRKAFDVTVKAWIESGLARRNCELLAFAHDLDLRKYIAGRPEELRTNKFT